MAQKVKKWEEWLTLKAEATKVVSYADYFARRPLFSSLRIKNKGEEAVENLTLSITNENGMLIDCEKQLETIPFESSVEVVLGNVLSPLYFSNAEEVKEERIVATLRTDKKVLLSTEFTVTTLPFDFWQTLIIH